MSPSPARIEATRRSGWIAAGTVMSRDIAELVTEVFPDAPVLRDISDHGTLLSIEKARRVLGYSPQHTWP